METHGRTELDEAKVMLEYVTDQRRVLLEACREAIKAARFSGHSPERRLMEVISGLIRVHNRIDTRSEAKIN